MPALGAQYADTLQLVVVLRLMMLGMALGLFAAFPLTRGMVYLLLGVSAHDPLTFIGVALLLTAVALVACYLPARRVAKVDPMIVQWCEYHPTIGGSERWKYVLVKK
jgi:hypothetical protein